MASLLESKVKQLVAAGFKGQLLKGIIRRVGVSSLDSYGDVVAGTATTYPFEGIRESFDARYAVGAGIPETDVKILVILGSTTTVPIQGDEVQFTTGQYAGVWHKIRRVLTIDPAGASASLQAYEIPDPTI